ncbi:MAG: response regulator transcription factor [Hyphomicrobium sp.]
MHTENSQPGNKEAISPTVLVVDDEPSIVHALAYLLSRASLNVRVAQDGDEALAAIEEHHPSLVLLDVMLPKRDGFEICEMIRANPEWEDIRIIMLTARGRDADREKGLALGADAYLTKPFSTREVLAKVQKILAADVQSAG